jgi:hypothetical protein
MLLNPTIGSESCPGLGVLANGSTEFWQMAQWFWQTPQLPSVYVFGGLSVQ